MSSDIKVKEPLLEYLQSKGVTTFCSVGKVVDKPIEIQEYYRAIDVKQQRFLKDLERLFEKHSISYRLMAGEIDLLGDGFRLTPLSLFEALEELSRSLPQSI